MAHIKFKTVSVKNLRKSGLILMSIDNGSSDSEVPPISIKFGEGGLSIENAMIAKKYLEVGSSFELFLKASILPRLFAGMANTAFKLELVSLKDSNTSFKSAIEGFKSVAAISDLMSKNTNSLQNAIEASASAVSHTMYLIEKLSGNDSIELPLTRGQFTIFARKYLHIPEGGSIGIDLSKISYFK